jgi:hypothetical protein
MDVTIDDRHPIQPTFSHLSTPMVHKIIETFGRKAISTISPPAHADKSDFTGYGCFAPLSVATQYVILKKR